MVDYSKWDRMAADLSDSDEEDTRQPTVTRLDSPTSVSFGGGKAEVVMQSHSETQGGATSLATDKARNAALIGTHMSHLVKMTRNGGESAKFLWGQTAKECQIYIYIPIGCLSKQITVRIQGPQLTVQQQSNTKNTLLFEGKFAYGIECTRDEAGGAIEEDIDWEIINGPVAAPAKQRILKMTVLKKEICAGARVVHWWPKVFEGQDPIDVRKIPDRKNAESIKSASKKSFNETWAEAHKMFKEKVKQIRPVAINC